ncbi:5-formyltetrahydrofolate cyclo-ligase [Bacillus sp. FJAT-45037]|uniref:5-formyltetrahydrofolate cyclo-ligase n=1 Tax=Bacillus sp. FJAT-45037 TaxID=2011007 RepID=UPI000C247C4C|nr:5-formyltetrahydrofolate cyclo-ligase [Bacillus sp. FJAT-45037]
MDEKKFYRALVNSKLEQLTKETIERETSQLIEKVLSDPHWIEARTIGLTISKGLEVDTYALIKAAWSLGKVVAVPKIKKGTRDMVFYEIQRFENLEDTFFGLKEPKPSVCRLVDKQELDLIFVPGIAYDYTRFRLGYGGGYYDTYLKEYKGITVSLAYSCQIVESVPTEEHDQPITYLFVAGERKPT